MNVKNASLTAEAALVLPVFIYGMLAVISILQLLYIKEHVQKGITQAGREASKYAFINSYNEKDGTIEETSAMQKTYLQMLVLKNLDNTIITDKWITGGMAGISCLNSEYEEKNNRIKISVSYYFRILFPILNHYGIKVEQQMITREFVGKVKQSKMDSDDENIQDDAGKEVVYITETGTVYHHSRDCAYLRLSVMLVTYLQLKTERNNSGGRYVMCEKCCNNIPAVEGEDLYITEEGDCYHRQRGCPGLKRTVFEVCLNAVHGRSACSKCGK